MTHKFHVVLFCNLKQRSVLYECRTYDNAKKKYRELMDKVKPLFCVMGRNKKRTTFYLGVVSYSKEDQQRRVPFTKDELGRNVTMQLKKGRVLMKVEPYWVEERIYDNQTKKHIFLADLMEILNTTPGVKMVYKLNSHLFVETDGKITFYSFKNVFDANRLMDIIMDLRMDRLDCLFSKAVDQYHRKYLYEHLTKSGYSKAKLYRHYSY